MTSSAVITMIIVQLTVTLITGYFFWKVIKNAPYKKMNGSNEDDSQDSL